MTSNDETILKKDMFPFVKTWQNDKTCHVETVKKMIFKFCELNCPKGSCGVTHPKRSANNFSGSVTNKNLYTFAQVFASVQTMYSLGELEEGSAARFDEELGAKPWIN